MRFTLSFDMDNAAFYDDDPRVEIARILDVVTLKVADGYDSGAIHDVNGNTIGSWRIT